MKKLWAVRKDSEAVSPVIATILMVAITVVLAAVLYVMVLGFGGTSGQLPTATLRSETVSGGVKFTFNSVQPEASWTDLTVTVVVGTQTAIYYPVEDDLDNLPGNFANWTTPSAGDTIASISELRIVDVAGNGAANGGDQILLLGSLVQGTDYTVTVIHEPTNQPMCDSTIRY